MYSFILPRVESKRWYHSPKYLIMEKFLDYLKERNFSGFSEMTSDVYTFILFFLEGRALKGFRLIGPTFYSFSSLSERLPHLELTQLILYPTPPAFVTGVIDVVHDTLKHEELHTTFDSLKLLLKDLESDRFEGTVTIQWDNVEGIIVLHQGVPETSLLVTPSSLGEGKDALTEILDRVKKEGGTINVYYRADTRNNQKSVPERVLHLKATGIKEEITSRYGLLGAELLEAASQEMGLNDILHFLCVDFSEIEPLCTYLTEKGYIELRKRDVLEEKTRDFWNKL
ncbi:MAG: hypothetical protein HXS46_08810 [Theionarchaea archaeon]|nr:MAG: hypothetical protein AYK18_05965 [Theionarchaea archaeon DG-70]MBU7010777.1 hypothetical protein [Theionarchaea archaeon]